MNTKLRLTPLTNEQADANWEALGPFLQKALDRSPQWCDLDQLRTEIRAGWARVLMIWDPEEATVCAVLYCEGDEQPMARVFRISYCGGQDLTEWAHIYPALRDYARAEGFDQIYFSGRKGWGRVFKQYTKESITTYIDDLREPVLEVAHG